MAITVTIDGTTYELPKQDDLTPNEVVFAYEQGAKMPEDDEAGFDPHWIVPLIVIAKRRAGEVVTDEALKELGDIPFSQMRWEQGPPPNRAAKRAAARASGGPKTARERSGSPSSPTSSGSTPG